MNISYRAFVASIPSPCLFATALLLPLLFQGCGNAQEAVQPAPKSETAKRAAVNGAVPAVAVGTGATVVVDGQAPIPIILPVDALPAARQAAEELAGHIELISGVKPQIQYGAPDGALPSAAIWVGIQPGVAAVFPGQDLEFTAPEEILMVARNGHVLLAGRDRWDPDHMEREVRGGHVVDGVQLEYGTANAVYAFMRDKLGILWLWPGDLGTVVDQRRTITLDPFEIRYVPAFRSRGDTFRLSRTGDSRGHSHDWLRRQGLQLDSLQMMGGHAFTDWWGRFSESNPEFFAQQPDGTRNAVAGVRNSPRNVKLCQSNPAVWDQVMADIAATLEREPWRQVFDVGANDSAGSGICVCDDCRAWDHPDAPTRIYTWENHQEEGVFLSDRYFRFANIIARKLREAYPDRDYYVRDLAYHPTQTAPIGFDLEPNVMIMFVGRFPLCEDQRRESEKADFLSWRERDVAQFIFRPNQWVAAGSLGIPQVAPQRLLEDWEFLLELGMSGLWVDTIQEHWATTGPHIYLMGQLAWNPTADGNRILDDYYTRGFGPAGDSIRAYWELMESEFGSIAYRDNFLRVSGYTFSPEFQAKAKALLDRAAAQVADAPEVFRQRVGFVRAGFDYTVRLYDLVQHRQADGRLDRNAYHAFLQFVDAINEHYPYAFNKVGVERNVQRRLGFSIQPDME